MNSRPFLLSLSAVVALAALAACGDAESSKPAEKPASTAPAKTPLVPTRQVADWCKEHGVPESMCTKCNAELIAGFKAKGDWCKEHGVPESQCFECNPELRKKFEAMAPK